MAISRTHYDNLKVAQNAPYSVIKAAYKALCQNYHPDKYPGSPEEAERIFKVINEAYAVLSDPVKRAEHDEWIANEEKKFASSSPTKQQGKTGKSNPFKYKARTNKSRQETKGSEHNQNAANSFYEPHAYQNKPYDEHHAENMAGEQGSEPKTGSHRSGNGFHSPQDNAGDSKFNPNPKSAANFFRHRALLLLALLAAGSGISTAFLTDANPIPSAETPKTPAAIPVVASQPSVVSKPVVVSKPAAAVPVNKTKPPQTARKTENTAKPKLLPSTSRERMMAAAQILEDKPLTIQKLTQAYNLYRDVEMQQPRNQAAKRGIGNVFRERIKIDTELGKNLSAANAALKGGKLAGSGNDTAAAYYRRMLLLDSEHPKALQGLSEIAEIYLSHAEAELKRNAPASALENVRLGLSVQEGHPKLLALAAKLQANPETGLHLSDIAENTEETSP